MYSMKTMKSLLLAGMLGLTGLLGGCGGGGAGGTTDGGTSTDTSTTITGTAATGAAMAGATVTVKDAAGVTLATSNNSVAADGSFTLTVSNPGNYTAPFMLRADPTPANPGSGDEHYSLLLSLDTVTASNNRVNITPITSLILFEATKRNLATVFGTPSLFNTLDADILNQARGNVVAQLPQLSALDQDFFGQSFAANGSDAYDAAMDALDVVRIEFSGDMPTLRTSAGGNIVYDATKPLYPLTAIATAVGSTQQVADGASFNLITATVTNSQGEPARSVTVNFMTTAGSFWTSNNPATAVAASAAITDANGVARLYLKSPFQTGQATITVASSDNATQGSSTINFVAGAPAAIGLSADPASLTPGGTTTLSAVVTDANGNLVGTGENVNFTVVASAGAAGGHFAGAPIVNRTTTNGIISLSYTAGATPGTETIVATATNGTTRSLPVTVTPGNSTVASLSLATSATTIPANGASTAILTATVRNANNAGVSGAVVTFSTSAGILQTTSAPTDANGVASVILTSGTTALTAIATATVSGYSANVNVAFGATAASVMSMNASPNQVKPGGTSTLVVAVLDNNGNPVANEPITLSFVGTPGSGTPELGATTGMTSAGGVVAFTYTAGNANGLDTIRATASNGTTWTQSISVDAGNIVVGSVAASVTNASIPVSTGQTVIRATVLDAAGQAMPDITVNFAASAGSLGASSATTDENGIASVVLTAGSQVQTAVVEATTAGFSSTAQVAFHAGAAANVTMSAAPSTLRPQLSSNLYAYVTDANNNPVAGETVTFAVSSPAGSGQPSLSSLTAVTNIDGMATIVYTAGLNNGTDTLTARTSNASSGSVAVTVSGTAVVVSSISLQSGTGASVLVADGVSQVALRANVTDRTGLPAVGVTVNFVTTAGALSVSNAVTDADGIAEVTLTSAIHTGAATISANASGFVASSTVTFVPGQPSLAKFTVIGPAQAIFANTTTPIHVVVLDANDNPISGQTVTYTVTTNNSGGGFPIATYPVFASTSTTITTNAEGLATATYTAGPVVATDSIRAALIGTGLEKSTTVSVQAGQAGTQASQITIGTSRTSVRSDNSETATLTVTALSSDNVVVPGVTVNFSASGGQLSAASMVTDSEGKATVNFSSGNQDKSNRTVTITATASGVADKQIPIQIVDSSVLLESTATTLTAGAGTAAITVSVRDAGGVGVYNVPVSFSQSVTNALTITPLSGYTDAQGAFVTDASGQFKATVTATSANTVTLTATSLGATASQAFTVLPGTNFAISAPSSDPAALTTSGSLTFTVNAPTQTRVRFATSVGGWTGSCNEGVGPRSVCTVNVAGGTASASLSSSLTGTANVQVDGLAADGSVTGTDTHTVYVTATASASISLQGSASNVQPSTGGTANTVTLIATVRDSNGQPVGNVPVSFSILNTTGGGETIAPVIKLSSDGTNSTDPLGQARAIFTAGSLPSGQTAASIVVQARALDSSQTATFNIVVGGTAGSVVIGQATHITDTGSVTSYTLPMSVLVADSNGNPVPAGTVVSLSAWPEYYRLGSWRPLTPTGIGSDCVPTSGKDMFIDENGDGLDDSTTDYEYSFTVLSNEDEDGDLILDPTEDDNGDGSLTPPNSSAGTLPTSVVTDANGVANFNLIYLKQYAAWVFVRVRATTLVQGSETNSQVLILLPWVIDDAKACSLPDSPFPPYE